MSHKLVIVREGGGMFALPDKSPIITAAGDLELSSGCNINAHKVKYSSLDPPIKPAQPSNSAIWTASDNTNVETGEIYLPSSTYSNTLIQINKTNSDSVDYTTWLDSINDGDVIQLRHVDNPLDFAIYSINSVGEVTASTIYNFDITLIHKGNSDTITASNQYFVSYVRRGSIGLKGAQGATGLKGDQGATGLKGSIGTNGTNGAVGATGAAGAQGATGAAGSTGNRGAQGTTGTKGNTGAQGTTGAVGAQGAAGTNGTNGAVGATGAQGATGAAGSTGNTGAQGSTGTKGNTGAQGAAGTNGTNGAVGATGATGAQGATGSNALVTKAVIEDAIDIQTLALRGALTVAGDITAFKTSDKRLKTNIKLLENPLEKLKKINGYSFDWIEKKEIHSNTGRDVGVLAQEVDGILKEATVTRDNGYMAVRYEKIIPLLINCIKEQQKQIDELKAK